MTNAGRQPRAQSRGNDLRAGGEGRAGGPAAGHGRSTQPRGAAFHARMKKYADGGGVTDPLAGMSPVDLARLRAELAAKPREMTVDERWRNYATTGADVAGSLPVIGNVMSAYDAYQGGKGAVDAAQAGDVRGAALNTGVAGLGALGAVSGIPWSRAAGEVARDARSTARMFAGPKAKTADLKALAKAEKMRAAGAGRDEIWKKTGWSWRKDGSPYFEIDDSKATFDFENLIDESRRLDDVLKHDEFYKAYPESREVLIVSAPIGKSYGQYHQGDDQLFPQIRLNRPTDVLGTTLHEGQHHIQALENAPRGANTDRFTHADLADEVKFQRSIGSIPEWESMSSDAAAFARYRRYAGEVEARNVQTRRNWEAKRRRDIAPWRTQDVPDDRQIVRNTSGVQNAETDRKALIDELMEKYNVSDPSHIYEMANTLPVDAKRMKKLSELMEKQDSKDIDAHYGKNYYGKITDYPSSERYKALADEYEKIATKYGKPGTASEVDAETIIELSRNIRGDVRRLKVLSKPVQRLINAETDDPVAGFRDFYYQREGKPDVYINGIYRADENPDTFWIEWVKGEGKNDLNKSDMQEIIRGIKERYPQVNKISGNRITGAREQADSKRIVTLPVDKFDAGGTAARVGEYMHGGRVTVGPVAGATGGRTDALAVGVPEGAYVIPADVVAALGEGNTAAGMRQLEGQFGRPRRAHGGAVVPIRVSDGEFVVSPEHVAAVGGADVLDRFVMRQRRAYVDQLTRMARPRQ